MFINCLHSEGTKREVGLKMISSSSIDSSSRLIANKSLIENNKEKSSERAEQFLSFLQKY
jgi:ATP phosphoribosyltransferase